MTTKANFKQGKKLLNNFRWEKTSFNNSQKDVNIKLESQFELKLKEIG